MCEPLVSDDYYSTRLLSHFLLHSEPGLKVAQIAPARHQPPTASRQQGLSSKEAIQAAHHRMEGRPYGKLLPRYAGPIAEFLLTHPDASRSEPSTSSSHLRRPCLHRRPVPLPQEVRPRPGQPRGGVAAERPRRGDRSGAGSPPPVSGPHRWRPCPPASRCRCRRPPFRRPHAVRRRLPAAAPGPDWLATAAACFDDDYGSLQRGLLTSVFALVRPGTHLPPRRDGRPRLRLADRRPPCPSRQRVGGWRRHLPWYEVDAFCRRTSPWHLLQGQDALVSYDEHTFPRWTHKFRIPKGYVTTRNKYMRCEKLFYGYDLRSGRYLAVRATPGRLGTERRGGAADPTDAARGQPGTLHALFDAGAGKARRRRARLVGPGRGSTPNWT